MAPNFTNVDLNQETSIKFEAYTIIILGSIGFFLNGFLSCFLCHYLRKGLIIPQKIVYLNLSISETLFSVSVVAFALRGPGLLKNTCQFSETFCRVARYAESYSSKVEMLAVLPITISILMLTLRGLTSCTTQIMILLCSVVWIVPALYLGSFSLLGVLKPGTFGVVFTNDSRRCDFAGDEYQNYVLGESIIFFYLPVLACVILYTVVGFYLVRYQVLGVARLARRGLWITFFYCLCWIPFMVVLTLVEHGHKNRTLLLYTYLFFYSSVIINPLVYVFTSKPFQVIMKRLMTSPPRIQRSRDPKLVHVNDQGSFEVGRGAGNLVETTSEVVGIVSMVEEISDAEMIEG